MFCSTNFETKKNIDVCFQKMLSCLSRVVQGGGGWGGGSGTIHADEKNNESRILKFHFPESRK